MGKKGERGVKEKPQQSPDDNADKVQGPYTCSGNFFVDFNELCKENNMIRPPPVIARPKRPVSPSQSNLAELNQQMVSRRGKEDKKQQQLLQQQQQQQQEQEQELPEDKEVIEFLGFKPKTFLVKDSGEYLKPVVQVETEHPDKPESVTEIFIRGWRIEMDILNHFQFCFVTMTRLHSLNFWRAGFTSATIKQLANLLSACENIKNLSIEANAPLEVENYHELIAEGSHLTKLRLRHCHVTPVGTKALSEQLGTLKQANSKLLSLDLSANKLGDEGALHLAKALRTNRTLLNLSLSNNSIGDQGCIALAQVLSRFFLTHEEILERRQLISEKAAAERAKSVSLYSAASGRSSDLSPPPSRRGESKDRPGSVRSTERDKSRDTREKTTREKTTPSKSKKPDSKEKEEKHDKTTKGKKEEKPVTTPKKAAVVSEVVKSTAKTKGGKSGRAAKTVSQTDVSETAQEGSEPGNPLLEKTEFIEPGNMLITGNFVVLFLNLARNRITTRGVDEMKVAIAYQISQMSIIKVNGSGLLKVILKGNDFPDDYPNYRKLNDLLMTRDPLNRTLKSPDQESLHD